MGFVITTLVSLELVGGSVVAVGFGVGLAAGVAAGVAAGLAVGFGAAALIVCFFGAGADLAAEAFPEPAEGFFAEVARVVRGFAAGLAAGLAAAPLERLSICPTPILLGFTPGFADWSEATEIP